MKIDRLTPPDFPALSHAEIANWLRIDSDHEPETLNMLVGSATEYIEGLTGLSIGRSTYCVTLDGLCDVFRLPLEPIQSVTSVEYIDRSGVIQPITDWHYVAGYLYFATAPRGFPVVTLVAGYSDPQMVPTALAHAIAVLVSSGYNSREEMTDQTAKTVERLCQRHKRYW
jgi:uncharacterized phiE125 gp8 family phage protein